MSECPEWMQDTLKLAMNYLVENETVLFPGEHKSQFNGVAVTMIAPDRPFGPLIARAQFGGKTWQLVRTRKPGR